MIEDLIPDAIKIPRGGLVYEQPELQLSIGRDYNPAIECGTGTG
jgi:hypothetical protein